MNNAAGAVSKKSDGPSDDQDYCDDVKEISHVCNVYLNRLLVYQKFSTNQFQVFVLTFIGTKVILRLPRSVTQLSILVTLFTPGIAAGKRKLLLQYNSFCKYSWHV